MIPNNSWSPFLNIIILSARFFINVLATEVDRPEEYGESQTAFHPKFIVIFCVIVETSSKIMSENPRSIAMPPKAILPPVIHSNEPVAHCSVVWY